MLITDLDPPREDGDDRKGVQSVEVGLKIAEVLAEAGVLLPLKEVALRAGVAPSVAHRYLISLTRAGLAIQRADSRYGLGSLALRLGFGALAQLDAIAVVEARLNAFSEQTGRTAMLSLWNGDAPVVMRWRQGARPVYTTIGLGSRMPAARSATGLIFLAWLDGAARDAALEGLSKADRAAALKRLPAIRDAGLAEVSGDLIPGLHAVAVPVFDGRGDIFAAFTAVAAGESITAGEVAVLRGAAASAAADLGFRHQGNSRS